jgi:hypothetical protein
LAANRAFLAARARGGPPVDVHVLRASGAFVAAPWRVGLGFHVGGATAPITTFARISAFVHI